MIIPTNKPNQRTDKNDVVFKTRREKFAAVLKDIEAAHQQGQPVLVGTASVEASEALSQVLKRAKITHIAQRQVPREGSGNRRRAGQKAVTIATNMAGRGTDIKLGEGVPELGELL